MISSPARQAVVQETGDGGAEQQQAASPAVHVQMLDSQHIIKYEIIDASSSPTDGNGTNTVTVSSAQHISAITPSSSSGAVVVTSNGGGDGNCSDQME